MAGLPPNAIHPLSRAGWRAWLLAHHGQGGGVWLVSFKKASRQPRMVCDEAVDEALCVGWIDSKPGQRDASRSMRWFAPLKAGTGGRSPARRASSTPSPQG